MFVTLFDNMALVRKVRKIGSSLTITVPSHVAQMFDIKEGDWMEYTLVENKKIVLEKKAD